jgi:UTP--glucose-1-phosphate uridylyltransferase
MVNNQVMYGLKIKGKRYDIGDKLGFLKTNIIYALRDPEISQSVKKWLLEFVKNMES